MNIEDQRKFKSLIQSGNTELAIKEIENLATEILLDGSTPLCHAVNANSIDLVKYLLTKGANPNAMHESGYPPLMSAIDSQNFDLIKLLLKNKADVNIKDQYGNDSLFRAVDTYNIDIVKAIVEAGANPFVGDNPENYSSYDSAKDIGADNIVNYFDSIRDNYQ